MKQGWWNTVSFWGCAFLFLVNFVLFQIAISLNAPGTTSLALLTMAICAVGMISHWVLWKRFGPKKPKSDEY